MRENNSNIFPEDGVPPIPIPSADEGWNKMQPKLDAALPVSTTPPPAKSAPAPLRYLKMFLIGSASIGTIIYTAYKTTKAPAPVVIHETTMPDSTAAATDSSTITYYEKNLHTLPDASGTDSVPLPAGISSTPLTKPQQAVAGPVAPAQANSSLTTTKGAATGTTTASSGDDANKTSGQPGNQLSTGKQNDGSAHAADNKNTSGELTISPEAIAAAMNMPATTNDQKEPPSGTRQEIQATGNNVAAVNTSSPQLELQTLRNSNHNAAAIHPPTNPVAWKTKNKKAAFMNWQVMLQWQFPLPLDGTKQYFNGPSGTSQAYRNFIPGLRIRNNWNKSGITLDLNAFAMQPGKDELYALEGKKDTGRYTITGVYLTKKFGYSAAIQYQHNITGNWHAAAGLQVFRWTEASTTKEVYESTNPPIIRDSAYVPPIYARKISQTTLQLTAEVMYEAPRWQSGIRIGVPFSRKDSLGVKVKTPVQVELLFRYRLWQRNKK